MYRCGLCGAVSKPGQTMKKRVTLRADGSIHHETPLCGVCYATQATHRVTIGARVHVPFKAGNRAPNRIHKGDRFQE
jgi:hypothetical protein